MVSNKEISILIFNNQEISSKTLLILEDWSRKGFLKNFLAIGNYQKDIENITCEEYVNGNINAIDDIQYRLSQEEYELIRIVKKDGIIILTCPNISWEIVHFLAAILNINHSEGPHTFLKKKLIDEIISLNKLSVLNYNTTIFLPFNNSISIKLDKIIEKITPRIVKEKLFLRHSYILKK